MFRDQAALQAKAYQVLTNIIINNCCTRLLHQLIYFVTPVGELRGLCSAVAEQNRREAFLKSRMNEKSKSAWGLGFLVGFRL